MGLRFFRRIRIAPGVTVNLSRSGVSTSVGGRGVRVTFGSRGTRETVGIPGTGVSYTTTQTPRRGSSVLVWLLIAVLLAVFAVASRF